MRTLTGAVAVATAALNLGGRADPVWLPLWAARRVPLASLTAVCLMRLSDENYTPLAAQLP